MFHPRGFHDSTDIVIQNSVPRFYYPNDISYVNRLKHGLALDTLFYMQDISYESKQSEHVPISIKNKTMNHTYNSLFYWSMTKEEQLRIPSQRTKSSTQIRIQKKNGRKRNKRVFIEKMEGEEIEGEEIEEIKEKEIKDNDEINIDYDLSDDGWFDDNGNYHIFN